MDVLVSRKEARLQPEGAMMALVDNIFDLFPVYANDSRVQDNQALQDYLATVSEQDRENLIVDVEILDDPRDELLDRAMFALVKQRGMDPLEPSDGIQWSEYLLGEAPAPVILQEIAMSVGKEGPGVRAVPKTVQHGESSYTVFTIMLTNAV
jgi:hypothetical protein